MTQNKHKYDNTHLWYRGELPICVKCGATPISLGQWGDDNWKKTHNGWKEPCKVVCEVDFKYPDLYRLIKDVRERFVIMTQNEHKNLIVELAKLFKPRVYVELGVGSGYVFNAVLPYVREYAFGCDINLSKFNKIFDELPPFSPKDYINGNNYYKSQYIVQKSTDDAAKLWPAQPLTIDLLFIDADHAYEAVKKDFITWSEFVTPGTGLILLHDTYPINEKYLKPGYCNDAYKMANDIFRFGSEENEYEIVTLPGPKAGISIIRKRGNYHLHWMENK